MWYFYFHKQENTLLPDVVVHTFDPNTQEAKAGSSLWVLVQSDLQWVPGQTGLPSKTLSQKTNNKQATTWGRFSSHRDPVFFASWDGILMCYPQNLDSSAWGLQCRHDRCLSLCPPTSGGVGHHKGCRRCMPTWEKSSSVRSTLKDNWLNQGERTQGCEPWIPQGFACILPPKSSFVSY